MVRSIQGGSLSQLAVGTVSWSVVAANLGSSCGLSMKCDSWVLRESAPSAQRGRKQKPTFLNEVWN